MQQSAKLRSSYLTQLSEFTNLLLNGRSHVSRGAGAPQAQHAGQTWPAWYGLSFQHSVWAGVAGRIVRDLVRLTCIVCVVGKQASSVNSASCAAEHRIAKQRSKFTPQRESQQSHAVQTRISLSMQDKLHVYVNVLHLTVGALH